MPATIGYFTGSPHTLRRRSRAWLSLAGLLLGLLVSGQVLSQGFDAQLDRTQVSEGDTVTLSLTAPGDSQGSPDLSPLNADFDIVGRSQGTSINIINGRSTSTRQWQLALLPKRRGKLSIPPLQLGNLSSPPLHLEVVAAAATTGNATGSDQPVMVEVDADTQHPYVQGEIAYRVRILSRVPLREASLSDPVAGDAIIERVGDDSSYTTQRNGETWQVIERHYAIFPQRSGSLKIESPVLSAALPVHNARRQSLGQHFFGNDPFADIEKMMGKSPFAGFPAMGDLFTETRPVRVRDRDITLDVRAQPAAVQGTWLPAKNLTLSETWSPDPPVFRVGEPVTRTVVLIADGLSPAQLPDITLPVPAGMKSYPDQPQSETRADDGDLITTRTMKVALIPTASGTLTLPALQIPWWDTATQQARTATLPARTIQVLPGAAGAGQPATATPIARNTPAASASPSQATPVSPSPADVVAAGNPQAWWQTAYWPWIAAAAVAGWLATLILWLRARRGHKVAVAPGNTVNDISPRQASAQARTRLRQACQANDPGAARRALLDWAAAHWPDAAPRGLSALAGHFADAQAREAVTALDRALYDDAEHRDWNGKAAWPALERALEVAASTDGKQKSDVLPDLYPQHG